MKSSAVSASKLLPNTFKEEVEEEEEDDSSSVMESDSGEGNENTEDIVDDLEYDVFNLLACNHHAVRILDNEDKEQVLQSHFQRAAQLLMKRYFIFSSSI